MNTVELSAPHGPPEALTAGSETLLLSEHSVVEIGPYRRSTEAVVVEPGLFEELEHDREQLDSLRTNLRMLLLAASDGVALPARTLEALGIRGDEDWRMLNAFQPPCRCVSTPGRRTSRPLEPSWAPAASSRNSTKNSNSPTDVGWQTPSRMRGTHADTYWVGPARAGESPLRFRDLCPAPVLAESSDSKGRPWTAAVMVTPNCELLR